MKGPWILAVVFVIACAALAMAIYQLWRQEHPQAAKAGQQPCMLVPQKQAITVEVRDEKLFINGKPMGQLPQTEALSVTVVDGKVYVNGKRVWAGKTDRFLLRLPPEGLGPPPLWLAEKEREEFKRDIQKWGPPKGRFQEELQRQRPEEEQSAPGRNRAPEWLLEPLPRDTDRDDESAEKTERHLEKLLNALERGEESVIPELEEFLQKVDRTR